MSNNKVLAEAAIVLLDIAVQNSTSNERADRLTETAIALLKEVE